VSASVSAVKSKPPTDKPASRSWIGVAVAMLVLCIGAAAAMFGTSEVPSVRRAGADAAVASRTVAPAGTASAQPVYDTLFPCRETEMEVFPAPPHLRCSNDQVSWCSTRGKPVACCAEGLVALRADGECGCPPGGSSRAEPAAATCPEATSTDRLSKEQVQSTVRAELPRLRACYEAGLARVPGLKGRISVWFEIAPGGEVFYAHLAKTNLPDPETERCMLDVFRAMHFSPPAGGVVTIEYPVDFGL
jgi:hypothetical protein